MTITQTKTPPNLRSFDEMKEIYDQLHKEGKVDDPYIVRISTNANILIFIGVRHSNNVDDPQNKDIEALWAEFIAHDNPNKVALCEGGLGPLEETSEAAIKKWGEPGLLRWLANKNSIAIESPEPNDVEEAEYLLSQGHSAAAIMTYYFGRQMYHWAERDRHNFPDWKPYIENSVITHYATLKPLSDRPITLASVLEMFKETTGEEFDTEKKKLLYGLSDPYSNPVSASSSVFRDISIFTAIQKHWTQGKDIFVVYGSGHAIVLEKAILGLTE